MHNRFNRLDAALLATIVLMAVGTSARAGLVTINANGSMPGDDFTNATTSSTTPATPGALLGATGWTYNNVRNNGHVGVNTNLPRSGNGSAWFNGTQGPAGNSSKADIEFLNAPGGTLTSMGTLGTLTSLSYDWYKSSVSAASQHAVLRLYVDADGNMGTANDRGYLVYERAYQTNNSVPTDQWNTDDLMSANLWQVRFGFGNFDTSPNWKPVSVWGSASGYTPTTPANGLHLDQNTAIYGLSAGIGSGWNTFVGAVDNITIGFNNADPTVFNFEVVPEPASLSLMALGALALIRRRRA